MALKLGKVGLVCDSGGFTGAILPGVAEALIERGAEIIGVGGSSVGALNAAKIAEDTSLKGVRELKRIWQQEIEAKGPQVLFGKMVAARNAWLENSALFNGADLEWLINKLDAKKVVASPTFLCVVVRDETNDQLVRISNKDQTILDNPELMRKYILASASIPGMFPSIVLNNTTFSDGLVIWPVLEPLAKLGCDTIFVVLNTQKTPTTFNQKWDRRLFGMIRFLQSQWNEKGIQKFLREHRDFHLFDHHLEDDDPPLLKRLFSFATSFVEHGALDITPHQLVIISPNFCIPNLTQMRFSKNDISTAIKKGNEQTRIILNKLEN